MQKGKFLLIISGAILGITGALYALTFGIKTPGSTVMAAPSEATSAGPSVYLPVVAFQDPNAIPPVPAGAFIETFDGDPSVATPWNGKSMDFTIHNRDDDQLYSMTPMQAQHGSDCSNPDYNTHTVTSYNDVVFQCKNHMMTATYGLSQYGGYSMIYMTPAYIVDTTGDFYISFDVSTFNSNPSRDWLDVWLTPYDQNLQLTLDYWLPDVQGEALNTVHFRMMQESHWIIEKFENGKSKELRTSYIQRDAHVAPSKRVRTTHMIIVQGDRMRFGIPSADLWWYDGPVPDFIREWNGAVVQIGHHSYTPDKDCNGPDCGPNTYHWDNIIVGPGQHMTMIHADKRLVTSSTNSTFVFDEPAPAGSHLRFSGVGDDLEVSYDGGQTWVAAQLQVSRKKQKQGHFKSYWMPVPAGTQSVMFRGQNWWGGEWAARDATIWSRVVPSGDVAGDPYSAAGKPMFSQVDPIAAEPSIEFNSDLANQFEEMDAFCEN